MFANFQKFQNSKISGNCLDCFGNCFGQFGKRDLVDPFDLVAPLLLRSVAVPQPSVSPPPSPRPDVRRPDPEAAENTYPCARVRRGGSSSPEGEVDPYRGHRQGGFFRGSCSGACGNFLSPFSEIAPALRAKGTDRVRMHRVRAGSRRDPIIGRGRNALHKLHNRGRKRC